MEAIKYKGKNYPVRTFMVKFPEFVEPRTINVSVDSLFDALGDEYEDLGTEANKIDDSIYFYIADELIALSGEAITLSCLDTPLKLITELN
jgi:hypothetical protein